MKIALLGYGKMGRTVEKLALAKGHQVVYKKDSNKSEGIFSHVDVAIDFSNADAAIENIIFALNHKIPIVSGTTGWLQHYDKVVEEVTKCNGSFIYASNFSIGVNLFFEINEYAAKIMAQFKEYLVSIEEIHHTQKKDSPSGTAISLVEGIIKNTDKKGWQLVDTKDDEIHIEAKRIEDVKGTHIIKYDSEIDSISLKHEAHSRDGFALGALLAAEWLLGKKGIFTMKDVLRIQN